MNSATHQARSSSGSTVSSFVRSRDEPAGETSAAWDGAPGAPSRARAQSAFRWRTAARHQASCSSVRQSSPTGSATIADASRPPKRACHPSSGVASTNWPSHQDRSPRPEGGLGATPSRCIPASHSCGASTAIAGAPDVRSGPMQVCARCAIRAASAEPGSVESSSAAVVRTLRLRSDSACSRNGSSAAERSSRSESRNIRRSSARSVGQVEASSARPARGSWRRSAVSRATRSANRPSSHCVVRPRDRRPRAARSCGRSHGARTSIRR